MLEECVVFHLPNRHLSIKKFSPLQNAADIIPFHPTHIGCYLLNVVVLWQPELSQEFGAPLLPL
jgi:hypothetical protein